MTILHFLMVEMLRLKIICQSNKWYFKESLWKSYVWQNDYVFTNIRKFHSPICMERVIWVKKCILNGGRQTGPNLHAVLSIVCLLPCCVCANLLPISVDDNLHLPTQKIALFDEFKLKLMLVISIESKFFHTLLVFVIFFC